MVAERENGRRHRKEGMEKYYKKKLLSIIANSVILNMEFDLRNVML
jgi:hypothetical protein